MRRWLITLALMFCLFPFLARAEGENRALLVGCDLFVTQEDTAPSSENNVRRMADALSGGGMNLANLVTRTSGVTTALELEALITEAFSRASHEDVSYFYISTHGVWRQGMPNGDMTLLLSDGKTENGVTALELRKMFDRVPGIKVLIIDACHAGAMIGKGVHAPFDNVFAGGDYKIICSSGGAEQSWYWSGEMAAEGYFSGALINALSVKGGYGADDNRDGTITLTELKRYLLQNHGASTVRTYPEEDEFPLLTYDASSFTRRRTASVENVFFSGNILTQDEPELSFTFNMVRPARIAYQLTYHRRGRWDFGMGQVIYDNAERFGAYGDVQGYLSPGMKERTISLQDMDELSYGYALLELLAIDDDLPSLIASQVLCVPPISGDAMPEVLHEAAFCPALGEEMTFVVLHQYPCELTVTIEDLEGSTIRRLASRQGTRPEQLQPQGSTFCWNGLTNRGEPAVPGTYRIRVKAYVSDEIYETLSEPFDLLESAG